MVEVIQASELSLHDVETKFGLTQVDDELFTEWWQNLPELTDLEKQTLEHRFSNQDPQIF